MSQGTPALPDPFSVENDRDLPEVLTEKEAHAVMLAALEGSPGHELTDEQMLRVAGWANRVKLAYLMLAEVGQGLQVIDVSGDVLQFRKVPNANAIAEIKRTVNRILPAPPPPPSPRRRKPKPENPILRPDWKERLQNPPG